MPDDPDSGMPPEDGAMPPDERSTSPRRRRGFVVLLLLMIVAPTVIMGAGWLATGTHQIVPGLEGCRFVRDRDAQIDCYTGQFRTLVREQGLRRALTDVDDSAARVVTLGADCHLAWHPIGERAGRAAAAGEGGFSNITAATSCQQGYAHGYTIGYLAAVTPTDAELVQIMESDCSKDPDINQILNCVHAYGHTIARRTPRDPAAAEAACEQSDFSTLPGGTVASLVEGRPPAVVEGALHQCLYGAWMEFGMLDLQRGSTVENPCGAAGSFESQRACYAYLSARVGALRGNLEDAARACHTAAPKGPMRDACVRTFTLGLDKPDRCDMLVADVEQQTCRELIAGREANTQNPDAIAGPIPPGETVPGAPEAPGVGELPDGPPPA